MTKNFDRRRFLKSSLTAMGTFFVAVSPLKSFAANNNQDNQHTALFDADLLYAQAKDFFYRKKYEQATALYQQLIQYYPARYLYYDGYARVLGAEQKTLEAAELYREGWLKYPENPYFNQRLALRLYDLCMGNRKSELEFCRKYGEGLLFEATAQLLLEANKIKPSEKGFYLSLLDVLQGVDTKNRLLERRGIAPIVFSEDLQQEINTLTLQRKALWEATRVSRKPEPVENVDEQVAKLTNRPRRNFHDIKEKKAFEDSMQKVKKGYKKQGMTDGVKLNNANHVERYTLAVLEEDPHDTDTIGKARWYYKKHKAYNRIITLNRFLYMKEDSPTNTLSLASSLAQYSKSTPDMNEVKQLLLPLANSIPYASPVYLASYCISNAQAHAKTKQLATAKEFLLQGLEQLGEFNVGTSYVLLEQYAAIIHENDKKSAGADILKTLSRKESLSVEKNKRTTANDPIWKYVDNYLQLVENRELNLSEQLKPLHALLKMQNGKSGDYNQIMAEINKIKEQMQNQTS